MANASKGPTHSSFVPGLFAWFATNRRDNSRPHLYTSSPFVPCYIPCESYAIKKNWPVFPYGTLSRMLAMTRPCAIIANAHCVEYTYLLP